MSDVDKVRKYVDGSIDALDGLIESIHVSSQCEVITLDDPLITDDGTEWTQKRQGPRIKIIIDIIRSDIVSFGEPEDRSTNFPRL